MRSVKQGKPAAVKLDYGGLLSVGYEKDGFAFLIDGFELSKKKSFDCLNQKCKKQRMYLMVSIDDFDPLKS